MQLLTTAEAAAYLRLKERKIYEMVAEGAVPGRARSALLACLGIFCVQAFVSLASELRQR